MSDTNYKALTDQLAVALDTLASKRQKVEQAQAVLTSANDEYVEAERNALSIHSELQGQLAVVLPATSRR